MSRKAEFQQAADASANFLQGTFFEHVWACNIFFVLQILHVFIVQIFQAQRFVSAICFTFCNSVGAGYYSAQLFESTLVWYLWNSKVAQNLKFMLYIPKFPYYHTILSESRKFYEEISTRSTPSMNHDPYPKIMIMILKSTVTLQWKVSEIWKIWI